MNPTHLISQLEDNRDRITALLWAVDDAQARWKPSPEAWSVLEVAHHLWDEEREDFRVRLNLILHEPGTPWPPIDPGGWVTARRYNQQDLTPAVAGFRAERAASLAWLAGLTGPDWDASVDTPWGWAIAAGDMLASWVAHDVLHMRQLVELHWAHTQQLAAPAITRYAGEW